MSEHLVTVDDLRSLAQAASIPAFAYSLDGSSFMYEAPLGSELHVGSIVTIDTDAGVLVGQVESQRVEHRASLTLELDDAQRSSLGASGRSAPQMRRIVGDGHLIGSHIDASQLGPLSGSAFAESAVTPAPDSITHSVLGRASRGAQLELGRLHGADASTRVRASAAGASRHTFVCGQSGSGKTFATGVLIEQLLLRTDVRIVVIDPNSDQVGAGELLDFDQVNRTRSMPLSAQEYDAIASRHQQLVEQGSINIASAPASAGSARACWNRMALTVGDLGPSVIGAVLGIDPVADDEAWESLANSLEAITRGTDANDVIEALRTGTAHEQQIARRLRALGIDEWSLWAQGAPRTLEWFDRDDARLLVYDIGSLGSETEAGAATLTLLDHLWATRAQRRPTIIVVDEAHNVCPRTAHTELQRRQRQVMAAIAGEGRKFGLHLIVATQRPARVDEAVTSQCDNLMLMRMNSQVDVDELAQTFSHLPAGMIGAARSFPKGTALMGGPLVSPPLLIGIEGRLTPEGGADVPLDWAVDPIAVSSAH